MIRKYRISFFVICQYAVFVGCLGGTRWMRTTPGPRGFKVVCDTPVKLVFMYFHSRKFIVSSIALFQRKQRVRRILSTKPS